MSLRGKKTMKKKTFLFLLTIFCSFHLFAGEKIKLPEPNFKGLTFEEAIRKRRSVRSYSKEALSLNEISQLLFSAQGITATYYGHRLRTTPSAGALYPFEIYLIVNRVEKFKSGVYHYLVDDHSLELVKEGDFREKIKNAVLGQKPVTEAGVVFILTAVFERTTRKYGERGYRYIHIEAGHIGQNILLQATSLGLSAVPIGAFSDEQIDKLLGIDTKKQSTVYLIPVGKK